jgi:hypothetical protein
MPVLDWSYSGDPDAGSLDAVRFHVGDTDETCPLLGDREIRYLIAKHGSAAKAAVYACRRISAIYAREADKQAGDLAKKSSQKSKRYAELAEELRADLAFSDIAPYSGGMSESDMEAMEADSDAVRPAFTRELHSVTFFDE